MPEKGIDAKVAKSIFDSFYTIKYMDSSDNYIFISGTRSADAKKIEDFYFNNEGKEIKDSELEIEEKDIAKKLEIKNIDLKDFHLYENSFTKQQKLTYKDKSNILIDKVKDLKFVKEYGCAGKKLLLFKAKILLNNKFSDTEYMFLINKDGKRIALSNNLISDLQVYPDGVIIESIAKDRFFIYDYTGDKPVSLILNEPAKLMTSVSYDAKTGMVNYSIENKQMPAVSITELRNFRIAKANENKFKSAESTVKNKPGTNFILVPEKFKE